MSPYQDNDFLSIPKVNFYNISPYLHNEFKSLPMIELLLHRNNGRIWIYLWIWVHIFTTSPYQHNESLSKPRVKAYTMSPRLHNEFKSLPNIEFIIVMNSENILMYKLLVNLFVFGRTKWSIYLFIFFFMKLCSLIIFSSCPLLLSVVL